MTVMLFLNSPWSIDALIVLDGIPFSELFCFTLVRDNAEIMVNNLANNSF